MNEAALVAARASWQRCRARSLADPEIRALVTVHVPALFVAYEEVLGVLALYREAARQHAAIVDRRRVRRA